MDIAQQPVLLWGHSLAEYNQMFDLDSRLLKQRILEIGFGPSSLNAELAQRGGQVVSCHELYSFPYQKIVETAACGFQQLAIRLKEAPNQFVWKNYNNAKVLLQSREKIHQVWLADLKAGLIAQRYQPTVMPTLAFSDHEFGLVLCANTHFGRWASTDLNFHLAAIKELCRIAHEVRVFPLLTDDNKISPLLAPLVATLHTSGYGVEVRQVDYELQKGGNAMLRVWATTCKVAQAERKTASAIGS